MSLPHTAGLPMPCFLRLTVLSLSEPEQANKHVELASVERPGGHLSQSREDYPGNNSFSATAARGRWAGPRFARSDRRVWARTGQPYDGGFRRSEVSGSAADLPRRAVPAIAEVGFPVKKTERRSRADLPRLLDQCFSDPDNVPSLLSAVWQAALDSKLVRTRRTPRGTVIDVKRGRRWFDQGTGDTQWVRAVAADPIIFRSLLRLALQKQHTPKQFDLLRRLRDLRRQPTYLRLRNLVRDAREHDRNGQDVLGSAFRWAGMKTGIFPQGLPGDWVEQLADKPGDIRRLVDGAFCCISRGLVGSGRRSDAARERYADHVAAAWKQATGECITYAKGTDTSPSKVRGQAYGKGLELMLHSLRLLDAAATDLEARRHIDRIRGWA